MAVPTVSASRGDPVTATGSEKVTVARMRSPAMSAPAAPFPGPSDASVSPVTAAARASAPSPSTTFGPTGVYPPGSRRLCRPPSTSRPPCSANFGLPSDREVVASAVCTS